LAAVGNVASRNMTTKGIHWHLIDVVAPEFSWQ
jgi:hypothetical protein